LANTLCAVVTETLANPQTFGPKSHVGLYSERGRNSWWNAVPQITRLTPNGPALNG
jgi:hypothetical protein